MKVYVLYHADLEDDRNIRGIFATEALAEEALRWDETYVYTSLAGSRTIHKSHHEDCCSVEPWEVLIELPDVAYGPDSTYAAERGPGMIPLSLDGVLRRSLLQSLPVWTKVLGKHDG